MTGPAKSGTHLLSDCLSLMPKMMFSGRHFALKEFMLDRNFPDGTTEGGDAHLDLDSLTALLDACPQGMFVTSHARFHADLRDLIQKLEFKHIILLRDPRDVVVSSALSPMVRQTWHPWHHYFYNVLQSDHERIMALISGSAAWRTDGGPRFRFSMNDVYHRFLNWLAEPDTLLVHFEDLVGQNGGGTEEKQLQAIGKIGEFIERPLTTAQAKKISSKMYGKSSLTFRKGLVGDWRNHFTQEHREAFREAGGDLLVNLGYEEEGSLW